VDANKGTGGYGSLYGPNIDTNGADTLGEGKIAGLEAIAYSGDRSGKRKAVLMVQVPASFDPAQPCIVTATSSGSRGIYGAIGTAGEWGLKHGCAVAYTDKGSGNGMHDLARDTVNLLDGTVASAAQAGKNAHFSAGLSATERDAFNQSFPSRIAYKHAHSRQNPEKDWGRNTLDAVAFAFYVLNEKYATADASGKKPRLIRPANTLVIASSASNGAGAALGRRAGQARPHRRRGGERAADPAEEPGQPGHQAGQQHREHRRQAAPRLLHLRQPLPALRGARRHRLAGRRLHRRLCHQPLHRPQGQGPAERRRHRRPGHEALQKLHAYGWSAEHDVFHASHHALATPSIVVTYLNTYGRFSVTDNVCGFSFATTAPAGTVTATSAAVQAGIFAVGNGVPPTGGINLVYNDASGGAKRDVLAVSPSTGLADAALDGALCARALVTGSDPVSGAALTGTLLAQSERVRQGIREVQADGRLGGKPTIIVSGRSDTLIPVNHASRAYYAMSRQADGAASRLRYYEVTNAQHFDAFIDNAALPGYDTRLVPLHVYFNQGMDLMYAHLKNGARCPPRKWCAPRRGAARRARRRTSAPPTCRRSRPRRPAPTASPSATECSPYRSKPPADGPGAAAQNPAPREPGFVSAAQPQPDSDIHGPAPAVRASRT
jgi:hydroxybutyrate-dimer hydrolase